MYVFVYIKRSVSIKYIDIDIDFLDETEKKFIANHRKVSLKYFKRAASLIELIE